MKLSDIPHNVLLFGNPGFRGKCAPESIEQVTFFNRIRREYPETWGALAIHVKNEGKRSRGQMAMDKAEGMTPGASDIIIPARITFVCEMKRRDHTKCKFQPGQLPYLTAAANSGAFACVALGCDAAWEAFGEWLYAMG